MPRWKWCIVCWKEFKGRSDKRYCSDKCRQKRYRIHHAVIVYEREYAEQVQLDPNCNTNVTST